MKSLLTLIVLFISTFTLFGQTSDSATIENSTFRNYISSNQMKSFDSNQKSGFRYQSRKQKQILSKDHLIFYTDYILMSPLESEITDLESRECTALLKRDTATLVRLWARDFTLDEPTNKLATGKNPLPYYVSFTRIVEKLGAFDNIVFTSGYELSQQLNLNGKLDDPIKRNYSHTWTKEFGVWKLTTNTHGGMTKSNLTISLDSINQKN